MGSARICWRSLRNHPSHSLTVILALAFGIGVSSGIFGLAETMLLRPFAFPHLDQVVAIYETVPSAGPEWYGTSAANFLDWQRSATSFAQMASYRRWNAALTMSSGSDALAVFRVSPNFFSLTGVEPVMGRAFGAESQTDGSTVVLGYGFWKSRLGGNPNIIGRTLSIDRTPYIVAGIMPEYFDFPTGADAWVPMIFSASEKVNRTDRNLGVVARLKGGSSIDRAQQEMSAVAGRLMQQYPTENAAHSAEVVLLRHSVNRYASKFLVVLMISVAVLLLLACANVANLQLARGAMRRKQLAMKIALGAARRRVIADIATEIFMFSLVAAALGVPIAYATLQLIKATVTGAVIRNAAGLMHAGISLSVLGYAFALAGMSAALVALPSIIQSADVNLVELLNAGSRGSAGAVRRGLRSALVGCQIGLATFLLIAASLLIGGFISLTRVPLGYDPHNVVICHTTLSSRDYAQGFRITQFYDEALRRMRDLPGVAAASAASDLPSLGESDSTSVSREGDADVDHPFPTEIRVVGLDYFRTLGIRVNGRPFLATDLDRSTQVAIVSEAVARRLWPGQEAVGRKVLIAPTQSALVVGVAADVNHFLLARDTRPMIYRPLAQVPVRSMYIAVRARGPLTGILSHVRAIVGDIDRSGALVKMDTFDGILTDIAGGVRVVAALLLLVATFAFGLALAGVYSVLSYIVAVQSRDIAIRMALGASPRKIVNSFLLYLTKILVPAIMCGVVLGLAFGRALSRVVSSVEINQWLFAATVLLVCCASVTATVLPVRRIAMASPAAAIR